MAGRRDYQEAAATVFRSMGLEVETDTHLEGVRERHAVDIAVRSHRAGLDQLWVVACLHRRRQVAEPHVAALATIVADVGADRGMLLSEVSFQAGARRAAYRSDVILTSLADLHAHAATELLSVQLDDGRRRLSRLLERLSVLRRAGEDPGRSDPGNRPDDVRSLWIFVETAQEGLSKVDVDRWPAPFGVGREHARPLCADDLASFVAGLTDALDEHEALFSEITNDPDAFRSPPRR
jgi:hypothetical protein